MRKLPWACAALLPLWITNPVAAQSAIDSASKAPPAAAGYKGGFYIKSNDGNSKLVIQARVQGRFEHTSIDEPGDRENENAFLLPRARLTLKGNVFAPTIQYKFQTDFGKGGATLKDFLVDYRLGAGPWLRIGQWKRPFSRQQINSSGRLEFVDRAITDKAFGAGRDIGIALHNRYEKSPQVEWAIGVFNGTGDKGVLNGSVAVDPATGQGSVTGGGFSNVPDKVRPAAVARIGYNHNGIKGYSEADFEGGPLRVGVGASVLAEFDADKDDSSGIRGEVDLIVKHFGFSASAAAYIASAQDGAKFSDQSYAAVGAHAQVGYLLANKYQPAVRYALVSRDGADNDTHEIAGGFSIYPFKHKFKWQTDVAVLINETSADNTADIQARTQLQLSW